MRLLTFVVLLTVLISLTISFQKSFRNYKVLHANLSSSSYDDVITTLLSQYEVDFWWGPTKVGTSEFMVAPQHFLAVTKLLRSVGVHSQIVVDDVEMLLRRSRRSERRAVHLRLKRSGKLRPRYETEYLSYNGIVALLGRLQEKYGDIIQLQSIGVSTQGRAMYALKLKPRADKPVIAISAGIHAREWLAISTGLNVLVRMIEGYTSGNTTIKRLVDHFEFHFIPIINPDGYTYSRFRDRMWRRNRRKTSRCDGVDLNRNFDAFFRANLHCNDAFTATEAFSEAESRNMKDYLIQFHGRGALFIDLHCFGRIFLVPWTGKREPPQDHVRLLRIARLAVSRMESVFNKTWMLGTPAQTLGYIAPGTIMDWVKHAGLFNLSYTMELPPGKAEFRLTGLPKPIGFIRDSDEILPTADEAFPGMLAAFEDVRLNKP